MRISSLEEMVNAMKKGVFDFTSHGKCSKCGNCCSNLLPLSEKEIATIRTFIRVNHLKEYKHNYPFLRTTFFALDMTCPFLDMTKSGKCTIYECRPLICRDFLCSKPASEEQFQEFFKEKREVHNVRLTFFGDDNGKKRSNR